MRPPINSRKHIGQVSVTTVAAGALSVVTIANAKDIRTTTNTDVIVGAEIKAVFVEMWVTSDDAAQGSTTVSLEKIVGAGPGMTFANSQNMNDYGNKNNIFYVTQGLTPPNVQSGIPFIRQWFKIPKGKRRMALNDFLVLNISGITNGANFCGFFTYKEYT